MIPRTAFPIYRRCCFANRLLKVTMRAKIEKHTRKFQGRSLFSRTAIKQNRVRVISDASTYQFRLQFSFYDPVAVLTIVLKNMFLPAYCTHTSYVSKTSERQIRIVRWLRERDVVLVVLEQFERTGRGNSLQLQRRKFTVGNFHWQTMSDIIASERVRSTNEMQLKRGDNDAALISTVSSPTGFKCARRISEDVNISFYADTLTIQLGRVLSVSFPNLFEWRSKRFAERGRVQSAANLLRVNQFTSFGNSSPLKRIRSFSEYRDLLSGMLSETNLQT